MFDKLKTSLGLNPTRVPSLLYFALMTLRVKGRAVHTAALMYVATGEGSELLQQFEQAKDTTVRALLWAPGEPWWPFSGPSGGDLDQSVGRAVPGWSMAQGKTALQLLLASTDLLTLDQWVRFARLLAAISTTRFERTEGTVPAWFSVLRATRERGTSGTEPQPAPWTSQFAEALLLADGASPQDAPSILLRSHFEAKPGVGDYPLVGVERYVHDHLDDVRRLTPQLSIDGRLNVLSLLAADSSLGGSLQDLLEDQALSTSKQVRDRALTVIAGLEPRLRAAVLERALARSNATSESGIIDQLARAANGMGLQVLQRALASDPGGRREEALRQALERSSIVAAAPPAELAVPPMEPVSDTPLGESFLATLRAELAKQLQAAERSLAQAQEAAKQAEPGTSDPTVLWLRKRVEGLRGISGRDLESVRDFLNGSIQRRPAAFDRFDRRMWASLPHMGLTHRVRVATYERGGGLRINAYQLLDLTRGDLRRLVHAAAAAGVADPYRQVAQIPFGWGGLSHVTPEGTWPLFAEQPQYLDEVLGLAPRQRGEGTVATALAILQMFPVLPSKYLPVLTELALGTARTNRAEAQRMLEQLPAGRQIAVHGLTSAQSEVRSSAAAWLARIGDPAVIPSLREALGNEAREPVQAALLSALQRLGDDISAQLAPDALLARAIKGLRAKAPASMAWFPLDALPAVRWTDGDPVDPRILRWWTVLAVKLKDPLGVGLIPIYVSLLAEPDRNALGSFVLDAWIAQDTIGPSDEEARSYATAETPHRLASLAYWATRFPDHPTYSQVPTEETVFEQLRREKLGEYLGSAINDKGLLALTTGVQGHYLAQVVQHYVRDHGKRRAQVEALITAASGNDDLAAIQLVLSVARRFKQATVQKKAQELVEALAERKGWTREELADRTIPSAGFDESGLLTLDYGRRAFTGRITVNPKTKAYGIQVSNPEGKPLKSLPEPAAADDAGLAKQAKAQLAASKKELKQVVDLQSARLYEAMCTARIWQVESWRADLLEHPVMAHLISTLVWVENPGESQRLFRPAVDGELIDVMDDTFELGPDAVVGLAHAATLSSADAVAWRAHLADYGVSPLFGQFTTSVPRVSAEDKAVTDHRGRVSDTFSIRGRATKRGYSRGRAEDGGWFDVYTKDFTSVGIQVVISFTGSSLPEELRPAAVMDLEFLSLGGGGAMKPSEVPPVLLAEAYGDYVHIASVGTFDPDWEARTRL